MPRETNREKRDNCTETKTDKMTDKRKQRKAKDIGSNIETPKELNTQEIKSK